MMQMAVGSRRVVRRSVLAALLVTGIAACSGDADPVDPGGPPPPAVQLKDIVISSLPSPYYHFGYDAAGRIATVSFASGLVTDSIEYDGDRISEVISQGGSTERLRYGYDPEGRVSAVSYVNADGLEYVRLQLAYAGAQLTGVTRARKLAAGFVVDKVTSLSYYPDGNLEQLTVQRPAIEGWQIASTTIERFEQYDAMVNVDGFSRLHDEFFDHLVLLPGVRLQLGNPGREVYTADALSFEVEYQYEYDTQGRPVVQHGALTFTAGPDEGKQFTLRTNFSYY